MAIVDLQPDEIFKRLVAEFFKNDDLLHPSALRFFAERSAYDMQLAIKHELGCVVRHKLNERSLLESKIDAVDLFVLALKDMRQQLVELLTDPSSL